MVTSIANTEMLIARRGHRRSVIALADTNKLSRDDVSAGRNAFLFLEKVSKF